MMGDKQTIPLGNEMELGVVWHNTSWFAQTTALPGAFGLSEGGCRKLLGKLGIQSVKLDDLKQRLELKGKVRFLDANSLRTLMVDRLSDEDILADVQRRLAVVPPPQIVQDAEPEREPERQLEQHAHAEVEPMLLMDVDDIPDASPLIGPMLNDHDDDDLAGVAQLSLPPPPLAPPPQPLKVDAPRENPHVVHRQPHPLAHPQGQQLTLPSGDGEWYNDDDYTTGKKFILPEFDRGAVLVEELRQYEVYWTRAVLPLRKGDALSMVTVAKRKSRVLLFLGFCRLIKCVRDPKTLTLSACLNIDAVVLFQEWMQKGRDVSHGNMVEYLSTFVSVAKFIYRDAGIDYDRVEIIQRLREMRNRADKKRSQTAKTIDDLADESRWLPWETFEEAIIALQHEVNEITSDQERPSKKSSRLMQDLVLLRYYAACPSRSGEVRLLQYIPFDELTRLRGKLTVGQYCEREKINVLSKRDLGCWTTWLADYKSFRTHGVSITEFTEELFGDLNTALNQYLLGGYRDKLLKGADTKYVFVSLKSTKFESSAFSHHLSALLHRLTGCKTTSNILRSSFVVNLMETGQSEEVRSSAASLMRHSTRQQEDVYDRRNQSSRKHAAQKFISGKREQRDRDGDFERDDGARKAGSSRFARGDLVCVPYVDTETRDPGFWFCKVMSDDGHEVTLMELEHVKEHQQSNGAVGYRANLRSTWKEPRSAVFHVDAHYDEESAVYVLLSTQDDIIGLLDA